MESSWSKSAISRGSDASALIPKQPCEIHEDPFFKLHNSILWRYFGIRTLAAARAVRFFARLHDERGIRNPTKLSRPARILCRIDPPHGPSDDRPARGFNPKTAARIALEAFTTTEAWRNHRPQRSWETRDPRQKMSDKDPPCSPFPLCLTDLQSPLRMERRNPGSMHLHHKHHALPPLRGLLEAIPKAGVAPVTTLIPDRSVLHRFVSQIAAARPITPREKKLKKFKKWIDCVRWQGVASRAATEEGGRETRKSIAVLLEGNSPGRLFSPLEAGIFDSVAQHGACQIGAWW